MSTATAAHPAHQHAANRFAVIPTPLRLDADPAFTGRGVTIAFLDSGFYPHPDIAARIVAFHDVAGLETAPPTTPQGHHWHGTQVAVVAAGDGGLSDGAYRGLASEAGVVLVKASDAQGSITEENIARGIEWVIAHRERYNIRILSISLGGDQDVPCSRSIVDQAAERAIAAGIVVTVAAGNSGFGPDSRPPIPPANAPSVITVGGYDDMNQLEEAAIDLYHSNYGATADGTVKPEVIAPAAFVATPILPETPSYREAEALSQLNAAPDYLLPKMLAELGAEAGLPDDLDDADAIRAAVENGLRAGKIVATHYQHGDGTSFATPIVASLAAQMLEANPRLTPAAVKQILLATADRLSHAPALRQGYGRINARRAVAAAQSERHALNQANYGPPRAFNNMLVFTFHDDAARSVALSGDFNDWGRTALNKDADGVWRVAIGCLGAGTYCYKFVVDGALWTDDPAHGLKEPDGFGGFNSLLNLM